MNALIVAALACLAVATAFPSGHHGGAVVVGPSGVVTGHGAIGPVGHGLGLGWNGWGNHGGAIIGGHGLGLGLGNVGLGLGVGLGHGLGAITNGGGVVSVSGHGAAVRGPHTAPVVVAGPSGQINANGLWGPTHNVGLLGHHGHGW